jgi:uncharacterized protein YfdQ (DUF2303 family)
MELNQTAVKEILNAAQVPSQDIIHLDCLKKGQMPVLHTPTGYSSKPMPELEKYLAQPLRKIANVRMDDAASFIWYAKEHGTADSCRIYLEANYSQGQVQFTALLNDHQKELTDAHWRDHKAKFSPTKSVEWDRWINANKAKMSQTEFASFLEDNLADIAHVEGMPTSSQIMGMTLDFEATSEKKFKSATRLQSGGISMEFIDREDDATRAKMQIFERFAIAIPVFAQPIATNTPSDNVAYRIDLRLKYAIRDGVLKMWFELVRPDKVLEAASKDIVTLIQTETGFPLLAGNAFAS